MAHTLTYYRGTAHTPNTRALEMRDVSVSYIPNPERNTGDVVYALQDVSFSIDQGEQIAVVGPNGAGKSTLFKLIVGIMKPSTGTVSLFGHEPHRHTCIAYVPQRSQIDWSFPATVEDVVMMGRVGRMGLFRHPRRRDRERVYASLERVNAVHLAHKQIGDLSGGQQQRVFIARTLAQEAELLLMDEPLTGLDTPNQQAIFDILKSLRTDGVTIMMATHDLDLAAERFDRLMLLNKRVIAFDQALRVLTAENLVTAYGGHVRQLDEGSSLLLADSCCGGDDHEHQHGHHAEVQHSVSQG